ncbi:MAG: flagellin [Oleiphilaceae bacterium]|nr:flagellin [Oleiphilaceae bacterium]
MPLSINGPIPYTGGVSATEQVNRSSERISSGERINSARDDAAGLAAASRLSQQLNGFDVAAQNLADGVSLSQVADGALGQLNDNIQRIRELALRASNGSLADSDRAALDAEAQQLVEANQGILEETRFNGRALFNEEATISFQVGPNQGDQLQVSQSNLNEELSVLGLNDVSLASASSAASSLQVLDDAQEVVTERRAEQGALSQRFESQFDQVQQARENTAASRSRVADADLAREISDQSSALIQEQVATAVRGQANAQQDIVLQLLS